MITESCTTCDPCNASLERVRYYPRQLIDANTLTTEQEYAREKHRRHNRYLHGWGVVCGLDVKASPTDTQPWQLTVCPGYLVTPQGDDICIAEAINVDLAVGTAKPADACADPSPCPPMGILPASGEQTSVYLAIRYTECPTRPERVHPGGCGCDESACEYSRVRDAFELKVLWDVPKFHTDALAADKAWCQQVKRWTESKKALPPVPSCPPCTDEPWVVIADIRLPSEPGKRVREAHISYEHRRALLGVGALQMFVDCR